MKGGIMKSNKEKDQQLVMLDKVTNSAAKQVPSNCDISILYDENKTIRYSFDIFLLRGLCDGDDFFRSDSWRV